MEIVFRTSELRPLRLTTVCDKIIEENKTMKSQDGDDEDVFVDGIGSGDIKVDFFGIMKVQVVLSG